MSDPAPATTYVLIWREPPSTRLRTYTAQDGRPLASPLDNIFPTPRHILDTQPELEDYLDSVPEPQDTAALAAELARSYLGWDPVTP